MELIEAFKKENSREMRSISNKFLVDGFVKRDKVLIRMSIIAHSLSMISEKSYYKKDAEYWKKFHNTVLKYLEKPDQFEKLEKAIVELDKHFGRYKENLLHRSKIRKGSNLYAWGVSLTLAAEMVGVPEYELMKHAGKTKMVDEEGVAKGAAERLKNAEEIL